MFNILLIKFFFYINILKASLGKHPGLRLESVRTADIQFLFIFLKFYYYYKCFLNNLLKN